MKLSDPSLIINVDVCNTVFNIRTDLITVSNFSCKSGARGVGGDNSSTQVPAPLSTTFYKLLLCSCFGNYTLGFCHQVPGVMKVGRQLILLYVSCITIVRTGAHSDIY